MGGRSQAWLRAVVLAVSVVVVVACSSSKSSSTSSSSSGRAAAAPSKPAGLALQLSGDLSGATDPTSTKVSKCAAANGELAFDGTVSLAGEELSVTISTGTHASIEIIDLAADTTWSTSDLADPTATISVQADTATSGSITAVASLVRTSSSSTDQPPTHVSVHGTYSC